LKLSVESLSIENRKGSISLDYFNSEAKIIYQVIESIDYETIARAIGRILMYRSLVESINAEYSYKIVVPQFPNSRIVQLCRELKIELVDLSKELIKK
jgi:hypothetical protein